MSAFDVDGLNAGYARALLDEYLENPEAVPSEWRRLFESGDSELVATHPGLLKLLETLRTDGNGASAVEAAAPAAPQAPAEPVDDLLLGGVAAAMALVKAHRMHGHLAGILTLASIASLGLPGLAGFWGEVLALLAAWNPAAGLPVPLFRTLAVAGGIGTLLTAGYLLWMLKRVNMGEVPERWSGWQFGQGDVMAVEHAAWTPLVLLIVALGVAPGILLGATNPAVTGWFTNLFT